MGYTVFSALWSALDYKTHVNKPSIFEIVTKIKL